jgi:Protein of unknown function (DUF2971)
MAGELEMEQMITWTLPTELYRFRTFAAPSANGLDKSGVRDLLLGRLKFSQLTDFNDPFEGRPLAVPVHQNAGKQRAALLKYLIQIHVERGFSAGMARRRAEKLFSGKTQSELVEFMRTRLIALYTGSDVHVCSLSGPRGIGSPLPWAHYADYHKGVCIHFDTTKPPIKIAHPVTYSETYPEIPVPRTGKDHWEMVRRAILTKSAQWKHEDEYRMVRIDHADIDRAEQTAKLFVDWDGFYALAPPGTVTGITFGARMAKSERTELFKMIDDLTLKIEVYEADLHPSRYEIVRRRLH